MGLTKGKNMSFQHVSKNAARIRNEIVRELFEFASNQSCSSIALQTLCFNPWPPTNDYIQGFQAHLKEQ